PDDDGWRPARLFDAPPGSTLVAGSVGRPEVVSGWDLATNKGRPTRRCAPAGSVYFLRHCGTAAARRAWAEATWLQPRADADTDRLDGYRLCAAGRLGWKAHPSWFFDEGRDDHLPLSAPRALSTPRRRLPEEYGCRDRGSPSGTRSDTR